jgi:hypothetical protein
VPELLADLDVNPFIKYQEKPVHQAKIKKLDNMNSERLRAYDGYKL